MLLCRRGDKLPLKILRKVSSWVESLETLDIENIDVNEEIDSVFLSALADYFANILKVVYFENKEWKVKKVASINSMTIKPNTRP